MKKKYLLIALAFVLVITGTITSCKVQTTQTNNSLLQDTSVSWAEGALDIQGLFTAADAVVVGQIGKVLDEIASPGAETPLGTDYLYYTDFKFIVESGLKAEVKDNSIIVRQIGKAGTQELKDNPLFHPGDHYLLFLREEEPGKFHVIGGPQGRFKIVKDKIYSMDYIYPGNNIPIPGGTQIHAVNKAEFLRMLTNFSK